MKLGCSGDYVKFDVDGYVTEGQSDFLSALDRYRVVLGCERNNDGDNSWQIFNSSNATFSNKTYDPNSGHYTLTITSDSSDGCGFTANKFRIGLYYGKTPPSDHASDIDEPAVASASFEPSGTSSISTFYEYFYDVSPGYFEDGDNLKDCPDGLQVDPSAVSW